MMKGLRFAANMKEAVFTLMGSGINEGSQMCCTDTQGLIMPFCDNVNPMSMTMMSPTHPLFFKKLRNLPLPLDSAKAWHCDCTCQPPAEQATVVIAVQEAVHFGNLALEPEEVISKHKEECLIV